VRFDRATAPVAHDADDPAIWIPKADPARALILGTDKSEQNGGLYVFGLDGAVRQTITPMDRPNNVDVEYGFALRGNLTDIAVVTERNKHRLRVFGIPADGGPLVDLAPAGIPVLEGQKGEAAEPMGIALFRRPADGAIFAIVAPKTGGRDGYLWQYRLQGDDAGHARGVLARRFGAFSGRGLLPGQGSEIEAVVVDDARGYVYYSDEQHGIRKYYADPDNPQSGKELAVFGTDGYRGDREGLAIYPGDQGGYIVSSDQIDGGSRLMIYPREGSANAEGGHALLAVIPTVSDATDGLEAVSTPLPGFPHGLLVMMNSRGRNYLLYDWAAVSSRLPR
jgi:3-phytase